MTSNSGDESTAGSLPNVLLNAALAAGDTIDCTSIAGQTISLSKSLPAIAQNITISGGSGAAVTIRGNGTNRQGFSVASGNAVTLTNFIVENCVSRGGDGGAGGGGGGGGVGGGGALYVHKGVNLTISTMTFSGNQAIGGTGGAGSSSGTSGGGGGGGFGGGNGGNGTFFGAGGGGGHSNGGAEDAGGVFLGGGGGGHVGLAGGGANNKGTLNPANQFSGGAFAGSNGGGGAGAGGNGGAATLATGSGGGGGIGVGADTNFGGGGGGGGFYTGGAGLGAGGGGGGNTSGGLGGTVGGGGGGASSGSGGKGGFGGGGGGSKSGTGGLSIFGGGTGSMAGGGGGAGLGGAIFIQTGASLTVNDGLGLGSPANAVTGGAAGGVGATAGQALGPDFFLQSGGSLKFHLTAMDLTISSNIDSDQSVGAGGGVSLQGPRTLTLAGVNTYTGGTTVLSGTLAISADTGLGVASESLTMYTSTLKTSGAITSVRPISLVGDATIDSLGNNLQFSGPMSGSGSLTLNDSTLAGSTVNLLGSNSYTGGTHIGSHMILQGNAASLQGALDLQAANSTVRFHQSGNGTYGGAISGAGAFNVDGSGILTMTGSSPLFTGSVALASGINLQVNGSIAGASLITVSSGGTLSGSGAVGHVMINAGGTLAGALTTGNVNNSGAISPGEDGIGVIHVNGTVTLTSSSVLEIEVSPMGASDLIEVSGNAMLDGAVQCTAQPGFYGFGGAYTLLTSGGLGGSEFATIVFPGPAYSGTISYSGGQNAVLNLSVDPFNSFPFSSANRRHVGNYIDVLNANDAASPALKDVINSLKGYSASDINNALDQMHPALYSALYGGMQSQVGGQLLSLFHRPPYLPCGCGDMQRVWVEPFGNWLQEGNLGQQTGFEALTKGIAAGYDFAMGENWILGGGCSWNESGLVWHRGRGSGSVDRYLGALYADFMNSFLYCGLSFYGGVDKNDLTRHIQFASNDLFAKGGFHSLDIAGQFSTAFLFGSPVFLLYPYANFDFFYFRAQKFCETGAGALNLDVRSHISSTIRSEAGLRFQIQDGEAGKVCVSPTVGLGWSMECPIHRPAFRANFSEEPFSFQVKGWDHTWNMFTVDVGLKISIYGFVLSGEYLAEIHPDGPDEFLGQRGNIGIEFSW